MTDIKRILIDLIDGELSSNDTIENDRIKEVMEFVSSNEKYDTHEILDIMLESYCSEISDALASVSGPDLLEESKRISGKMMDVIYEYNKNESNYDCIEKLFVLSLASAVTFKTILNTTNDYLSTTKNILDNITEDDIDFEKLSKDFKNGKINYSFLAEMLKEGLLTLNDIQNNFGNDVAIEVLEIASKDLKNDTEKKDKNSSVSKSNSVEKELEEFEIIKRLVEEDKMSLNEFLRITDSYCDETKDVIMQQAACVLESLSKRLNLKKEGILDLVKLINL